jgi:hypothetical protein
MRQSIKENRPARTIGLLLFCLLCLPAISASVNDSRFEPFIEKHDNGWIDWDNGMIYGVGRGYLNKNNKDRSRARRAAAVIASGNIVKLAAGLNLDDARTLQTIGDGRVVVRLKAFLRDRPHKSSFVEGDDPYYEEIRVASLRGVSGLTAKLIDYFSKGPVWEDFPLRTLEQPAVVGIVDDENQPWLLLDARDLPDLDQVSPALFPKIISDDGEVVYELSGVEDKALVDRGMMNYVVTDESAADLRSNLKLLDHLLAGAGLIVNVPEAMAEEQQTRKKRRRYIIKDVKAVQGLAKTNLVISAEDAVKLKGEDSSSRILKKCRVVVIVSSPIGGVEGTIPTLLAGTGDAG